MTSPSRLRSLDVFRGATVALMILVNNAGDWGKTWWPLLHAEWHGWTPTDLVFPFFLFLVGVAIPFSLGPRLESAQPDLGRLHRAIFRRSALLFLIGLALIWFPYYTVVWERARIFGVLQRIGIVFCFAALAYVHLSARRRVALSLALLGGYWAAMRLVPVPGFGAGDLSPQGNLAFHVDHLVLGPHIWRYSPGPGDPEGLLSTLPAIVSALAGIFAGEALRRASIAATARESSRLLRTFCFAGLALAASGLALARLFPINKTLWSPTYVLFTTGAALLLLSLIHWSVDLRGRTAGSKPFEVFGRNAILAYAGSGVMARLLTVIRVGGPDGGDVTLQKRLYSALFDSWLPDFWASFGWALSFVLIWLAICWALDRRGIYLRV